MEFYIKDAKKASAYVRDTIKSARSIEQRLHVSSVTVAMHAIEHGDASLAQQFVSGLDNAGKNALRSSALKTWLISDNCPFVWGSVELAGKKLKTVVVDKAKAARLRAEYEASPEEFVDTMSEVPYFTQHKEPEFRGFNLMATINAALKKADKMALEHPGDAKIDLTGLDDIKAIVAKLAEKNAKAEPGNLVH